MDLYHPNDIFCFLVPHPASAEERLFLIKLSLSLSLRLSLLLLEKVPPAGSFFLPVTRAYVLNGSCTICNRWVPFLIHSSSYSKLTLTLRGCLGGGAG